MDGQTTSYTPREHTPRRGLGGSSRGLERAFGLAPPASSRQSRSTPRSRASVANPAQQGNSGSGSLGLQDGDSNPDGPIAAFDGDDYKKNEEVMKRACARDRVAFLLGRAPATSDASTMAAELARTHPAAFTPLTSSKEHHCVDNHIMHAPRVLKWERRKDSLTDYFEVHLRQASVGFRK
eukprot:CAMPEP_0172813612 /NCGR_PEP_ID=MMETSP1075-20121228/10769_1 /TAXON_ID=2916 /ORGANISM="Ceratium fusus, Strain PA161109" /LENGTH=179 /DNA_ID=CAMNT_0013653337 /DNA_START=77 /DNA_END=616 /DNA_ORIENTATION=+